MHLKNIEKKQAFLLSSYVQYRLLAAIAEGNEEEFKKVFAYFLSHGAHYRWAQLMKISERSLRRLLREEGNPSLRTLLQLMKFIAQDCEYERRTQLPSCEKCGATTWERWFDEKCREEENVRDTAAKAVIYAENNEGP